jgi:hypothetical protein
MPGRVGHDEVTQRQPAEVAAYKSATKLWQNMFFAEASAQRANGGAGKRGADAADH